MADDLNYAVTVNSEGKLSYPENFISTNNIAQFGNDVSGILKDLTLDGVSKIRIYDKKQKMWTDTYNYVYLAQNENGVVALAVSDNYPVNAWKIKGSNGKTYDNIQTAIDEAADAGGGEVWIAAGTYKHGSSLTMKNNVAIYGGFAGTETSKDQRVEGNETILDGEGKYRVFYNRYSLSKPLTNSAKLDNVTIQNGYVDSNNGYNGAGMCNNFASPEITNCTFSNNSANAGGGMYNYDESSPTLTNCTFSNNSASRWGGGMYNEELSSPTLTNCTFSGNSASDYGGGMYNRNYSNPVLTNCTFSGNSASDYGGGMYNYENSSPTLTNCTFTNNSATGDSSVGGGMYNFSSSPTLTNCTFANSRASCGGGMDNFASSPTLANCTFSNNSASSSGGGMFNEEGSAPVLTNCILWGNTASNGNEIYDIDFSTTTIDTCIIQGGYSGGTNVITGNPLLQPLADNGGYVETCAVIEGSSAIGAGKVVEGVTTDARGIARSTTPTIGAYEYTN